MFTYSIITLYEIENFYLLEASIFVMRLCQGELCCQREANVSSVLCCQIRAQSLQRTSLCIHFGCAQQEEKGFERGSWRLVKTPSWCILCDMTHMARRTQFFESSHMND